jgi:hypothetical protein
MYIKPVAATVMGVFNNDVEHENGAWRIETYLGTQ